MKGKNKQEKILGRLVSQDERGVEQAEGEKWLKRSKMDGNLDYQLSLHMQQFSFLCSIMRQDFNLKKFCC